MLDGGKASAAAKGSKSFSPRFGMNGTRTAPSDFSRLVLHSFRRSAGAWMGGWETAHLAKAANRDQSGKASSSASSRSTRAAVGRSSSILAAGTPTRVSRTGLPRRERREIKENSDESSVRRPDPSTAHAGLYCTHIAIILEIMVCLPARACSSELTNVSPREIMLICCQRKCRSAQRNVALELVELWELYSSSNRLLLIRPLVWPRRDERGSDRQQR